MVDGCGEKMEFRRGEEMEKGMVGKERRGRGDGRGGSSIPTRPWRKSYLRRKGREKENSLANVVDDTNLITILLAMGNKK